MPRLTITTLIMYCALSAAHAQTVYKYQMPDGRIVYTSETMSNAKLLGTVREPQAAQPVDAAKQEKMQREREAASQSGRQRSERLAAVNAEVAAATRALEEARARQVAGVEPEEGDRTGTVRAGGSRANSAYLERQQQLQEAVNEAQKRLDAAYKARNEAR